MKKKSLAFKIFSSLSVLLVIVLISSTYTILMIQKTQGYANETEKFWLPSVNFSHIIRNNLALIRRSELRIMVADSDTNRKAFKDRLKKSISDIDEFSKKYEPLITTEEEKKHHQKFKDAWQKYKIVGNKIVAHAEQGRIREANSIMLSEGDALVKTMEDSFEREIELNFNGAVKSTEQGKSLTNITVVGMSLIMFITAGIGIFIVRLVFNSTHSINNSIENLKAQSITTNEVSVSLKKDSQELDNTVTKQAEAIHETTAAINEITSMVSRTTENARESSVVAKAAADKADEGQKTMQRLVDAMEQIHLSNKQLQNINNIIGQVYTKTAVINDIVAKTELLSLNANIEAARAGEYGKGFAVVAEEIGGLAKMSGESAAEIQELLNKSLEQVSSILNVTKLRVADGKKVTHEAQAAFKQIAEDISSMNSVIIQISEATREQEIGVRQIAQAMTQIDKATQNNQLAIKETSESSHVLVEEGQTLDSTAKRIELLIKGQQAIGTAS